MTGLIVKLLVVILSVLGGMVLALPTIWLSERPTRREWR